MTASSRFSVPILALCLVVAAAMQPAAQPEPPGTSVLRSWSPRHVFESSIALEIEVRGTARPTPSERKDGYVAVGDVAAGDGPGEWIATTPHAAHWFDAQWREVAVTDLGRRFRSLYPVRFKSDGPVALVAEQGDIDRLIEISPEEFTFGHALNLGAEAASAPIHFALSSHCLSCAALCPPCNSVSTAIGMLLALVFSAA